eukprot:NODE_6510_length_528_cov_803.623441_g6345_i0.p1 GENE.NODE_6510_length_528_cov_803.623441_g6345_i0~~NODE_6510_length_528_cov_803.623441_g6345_i0.p1  ORF type:complete len:125 (-),score=6.65 NODE_6510_length_528_cov_803.623441_g6345_i0:95-469(-)
MGRGGSRRSSPARPRSPPTSRAPPPAPRTAAAPPAAASRSGGFMQNIASTAMGVGLGHAISHTLLGGMSRQDTQEAVQTATTNVPQSCSFQLETFNKCLEKSTDPSQCEWIYQDLMSCKNTNAI